MARAQYRKNGVMRNIIGFIDATVRPCCRSLCAEFCSDRFFLIIQMHIQAGLFPGGSLQLQGLRVCVHALKFQTVMLADGIISHVSGPWSGRRHDTYIFINSELPQTLGTLPRMPHEDGGELMAIYADPGKIRLPGDCGICACFVTATAVCFSSLTITQDTH